MKDDTISRQAAIRIASGYCHPANIAKELAKLPSVQPDVPDTNVGDMISRQAAIDEMHNYWQKRLETLPTRMTEDGEVYSDIKSMDRILEHNKILSNMIKQLPSVQPERKPGKWIKAIDELGEAWSCSECTTEYTVDEMDEFPKWAKYCPECGADMRGEQK